MYTQRQTQAAGIFSNAVIMVDRSVRQHHARKNLTMLQRPTKDTSPPQSWARVTSGLSGLIQAELFREIT